MAAMWEVRDKHGYRAGGARVSRVVIVLTVRASGFALAPQSSTPFPAFPPPFALPACEFGVPLDWLLHHGTSFATGVAVAGSAARRGAAGRARPSAARQARLDGRRSWDEVVAENRLAGADADANCLACARIDAICAANATELARIDREIAAIESKRDLLCHPSASTVNAAEPPVKSAQPRPSALGVHPALLTCARLCSFHHACLLDPPASASDPSQAPSTDLPREPVPTPRLADTTDAATWAKLDASSFRVAYTLPEPSTGPAPTLPVSVPAAAASASDSHSSAPLAITSPANANDAVSMEDVPSESSNGAVAPAPENEPSTTDDSVAPASSRARGRARSGRVVRSGLDSLGSSLHIDMSLGSNARGEVLPLPMVDDSGRRSSRVQLLQLEAERRAADEERETQARLLREAAEARVAAEVATVARIQDSAAPPLEGATSVSAALTTFPALLAMAAPDALLHHRVAFRAQTNQQPTEPKDSAQTMPPLHLCMRLLEIASFASHASNLAKSSRIPAAHMQTLPLRTLRQVLTQEKKLPRPFASLSHQLLTADVVGLPPLHTALRLCDLSAVRVLLEDLLVDDFSDEETRRRFSSTDVHRAPLKRRGAPESTNGDANKSHEASNSKIRVKPEPGLDAANESASLPSRKRVKLEDTAAVTPEPSTPSVPEERAVDDAHDDSLPLPSFTDAEWSAMTSQRLVDLRGLARAQLQARETSTTYALTPVLYALYSGADDTQTWRALELLVANGARLLDTDAFGRDATHWAALKAFPLCLRFILDHWPTERRTQLLIGADNNAARDDDGNTPLHYAIAAAMDPLCAGCPSCVRVRVRTTELHRSGVPSSSEARSVGPPRTLPSSTLPPFLVSTLLRLRPLLRSRVLHTLVRQTLWKGEVRIAESVEQLDDADDDHEAVSLQAEAERSEAAGVKTEPVVKTENEPVSASATDDAAMTDAPSRSLSSTPSPSPSPSPPSEHLSVFFVSLLRLWRTLVHRDLKKGASATLRLSPVVADLASLLPLTLFLEPPTTSGASGAPEEEQVVLARASKCTRREAALACARMIIEVAPDAASTPNAHGLTPTALVRQWQHDTVAGDADAIADFTPAERSAANEWRVHVRQTLAPLLGVNGDEEMPPPLAPADPALHEVCAPMRYLLSDYSKSSPAVASSSEPTRTGTTPGLGPCEVCGAGCVPPIDRPQVVGAPSQPQCVCYCAPSYRPMSRVQDAASSIPVLEQSNLNNGAQREQYLIPVVDALGGVVAHSARPVSTSPSLQHSYTRCAVYASHELERDNAVGQANVDTRACSCDGPCSANACPCSKHRFGTADPIANATEQTPALRGTTSCIFECQPLCQCNCVLGGPDITDVQRFHVRYRLQVVRHASGWRVHTLEFIPRGSFVMEYACEVLTETEAGLREMEYDAVTTQHARRFILKIAQPEQTPVEANNEDAEDRKRRDVLKRIAFDATRFGHASSFLRHGCRGTLAPTLLFPNAMRVPKVMLHASRDIQRGEELLLQHDAQECVRRAAVGSGQTRSRVQIFTA